MHRAFGACQRRSAVTGANHPRGRRPRAFLTHRPAAISAHGDRFGFMLETFHLEPFYPRTRHAKTTFDYPLSRLRPQNLTSSTVQLLDCLARVRALEIESLSRAKHFLIGLGLLLLSAIWSFLFYVIFIGNAIARDSVPGASVHDPTFVAIYAIGGAGLLCGVYFAIRSLGRTLQPAPRPHSPAPPSQPGLQEQRPEAKTSDEKLAHLIKHE